MVSGATSRRRLLMGTANAVAGRKQVETDDIEDVRLIRKIENRTKNLNTWK